MGKKYKGLVAKFDVFRHGSGEQIFGSLFVLLPEKDSSARQALAEYANHTQNQVLSDDIKNWIGNMPWNPICDNDAYKCPHCGNEVEAAGVDCINDGYYGCWTHYNMWYCSVCDNAIWTEITFPPDYFDGE